MPFACLLSAARIWWRRCDGLEQVRAGYSGLITDNTPRVVVSITVWTVFHYFTSGLQRQHTPMDLLTKKKKKGVRVSPYQPSPTLKISRTTQAWGVLQGRILAITGTLRFKFY